MSEERAASRDGKICLGCSSMFGFHVGNAKKIARIIPGCNHNLCEQCIVTDGTNTGQVGCRYPGCSTKIPWTGDMEQFLADMFILGSMTYHQQIITSAPVEPKFVDKVLGVTASSEEAGVLCGECEEKSADCYCQNCDINFCSQCFDRIHESAKSLRKHKSLSLVMDSVGRKVLRLLKMQDCADHAKKTQYVTDDGTFGCEECVTLGKLVGLKVVTIEGYNENGRMKLKDKIVDGKYKLDSLKLALDDLKSENVKGVKSAEEVGKKIKSHFLDCHSHLQRLEHDLNQKLENQNKIRKTEFHGLFKSTSEKISEVSSLLKIAEEAISKDSCVASYNLDEMINFIEKLEDPCAIIQRKGSNSLQLEIEPAFIRFLKNHISLIDTEDSKVQQVPVHQDPDYEGQASNEPTIESGTSGTTLNTVDQIHGISENGRASANPASSLNVDNVNDLRREDGGDNQSVIQVNEDTIEHNRDHHDVDSKDNENVVNVQPVANILEKGKTYTVLTSDIKDPGEMCVQVVAIGDDGAWGKCLENLCNDLQKAYSDSNSERMAPLEAPKVGTICVAKFTADEKYYRAQVVRLVTSCQVEIKFIDFGNSEVTNCSNLRPLLRQFLDVPVLSHKIALGNVLPIHGNNFNEESITALKKLTELEELKMFVEEDQVEGTPMKVALYKTTIEKDICINAWMVKEGLTKSATAQYSRVEFLKLDTIPVKETTDKNKLATQHNLSQTEKSRNDCIHQASKVETTDQKSKIINAKLNDKEKEKDANTVEYHVSHVESPSRIYVLRMKDGNLESDSTKQVHISDIRPTGGTDVWSITACEYLVEKLDEVGDSVTLIDDGEKVVDEDLGINSQPVKIMIWETIEEGPFSPQGREQVSLSQKLINEGLALPASNSIFVKRALLVPENIGRNSFNTGGSDVLDVTTEELSLEQTLIPSKPYTNHGLTWRSPSPLLRKHFIGTPTHVDWNCIVSIQTVENKEKVKKIKQVLNSHYSGSSPEPHDLFWFAGQPCIAQFEIDQNWSRGRIVKSVELGVFEVEFVDFGNVEEMKANELRKTLFCQDEPVQCFQLQLVDVVPKSQDKIWSKEVLDFIHKLVVDQNLKVSITDKLDEGFPVKGKLATLAGVDISELLVKNGYAEWANGSYQVHTSPRANLSLESVGSFNLNKSIEEYECDTTDDDVCAAPAIDVRGYQPNEFPIDVRGYQPNELPSSYRVGVDFPVMVVGQEGCDVSCHLVPSEQAPLLLQNLHHFSNIMGQLQVVGDQQARVEEPTIGQAVIARFSVDRKWFRAVVTNVSPLKVCFVDYGNSEEVEEVKLLPPGFEELPEQVVFLETVSEVNFDQQDLCSPKGFYRCRILELHESDTSRNTVATVEFIRWASEKN